MTYNNGFNYTPQFKGAVAKRRFALCAPFLLYAAGVFLIALFFFMTFVYPSPLWSSLLSEAAPPPETETVLGTEVVPREVTPVEAGPGENGWEPIEPIAAGERTIYNYLETLPPLKQGYYLRMSEVGGFSWGDMWARLSVHDDGLSRLPVYQGDNSDILKAGIGHLYGSCFPGQGGVILLPAHVAGRLGYFYNLCDKSVYRKGAQIKLDTAYGVYVYEVVDTEILNYKDKKYANRYRWNKDATDADGNVVGALEDLYAKLASDYDTDELLVMYTCYPRGTTFRTDRYYVVCRKIYGYPWG